MCPPRAVPPAAAECLIRAYSSRPNQKGGTCIRADVHSLEEHERFLDEERYRPERCPKPFCAGGPLQVHAKRPRALRGWLGSAVDVLVVLIAIYRCPCCGGTWRVLPAFIARCLHSPWKVVRKAAAGQLPAARVPGRTQRRWRARLAQDARVPTQVLGTSGAPLLRRVAQLTGLLATRTQLVAHFARAFGCACGLTSLAELLHRMEPGIRLA